MHILVVKASPERAARLGDHLTESGHTVDYAARASFGLSLVETHHFDAIVATTRLPGTDGYTFCHRLRQRGKSIPVLLLGQDTSIDDLLKGFDSGADGYLTPPFDYREVNARLRAMHRRGTLLRQSVYRAGDLEYDVGTLTVRRAGRTIHLGPVDMTVLRILMQHAPRPVSYQQLLHAVWPDRDIPLNTVRSHVYRLRKLIDRPFALPLIQTCHGTGYAITTVDAHGPAAAPAAATG